MDVSAILTVAAQVAGASGLVTVSSRAAVWMRERARFSRQADVAKELLGLQRDRVAYRHDSRHVLYAGTERLHPDNLHGLVAAGGNVYRQAERAGTLVVADEIVADSRHDLALIGSPTAEGVSRLIFGYRPDGDPDSLSAAQVPLDLPYRWVLSKNEIDEAAVARRFVAGKGLVERPNWRITGRGRIYIPRVDEDGMLVDDYLLVTRVRNYLSSGAIDGGHFITSFGGSHGTGTRGVELLFKDKNVLAVVAQQLRQRPSAFQMLFRVSDMEHHRTAGTRARKIDLVEDAVILPDDDAVWRTAVETVRRGR